MCPSVLRLFFLAPATKISRHTKAQDRDFSAYSPSSLFLKIKKPLVVRRVLRAMVRLVNTPR